jgi:hypothetical protein
MKRLVIVLLVLIVAVGALAYWRGWLIFPKEGDSKVGFDTAKFNADKDAFGKTLTEKTKAMKDQMASLWKKTESLSGDDKAQAQKELGELDKKHDRLEQQIKELNDAGQDRFVSLKEDLTKSLHEVDSKIQELSKKLEKGKDK